MKRIRDAVFRDLIAHLPYAVFWKDCDSVYLGCNDHAARDAGMADPNQLIGKTDYDTACSREEADFYRKCDREVLASGQPRLEIEESQRRSDGSQAVISVSKVPLRDATGQIIGILGFYTDITERKRLAEQYRQAQRMEAIGQLAGGVAHDFNNLLTIITGYTDLLISGASSEDPSRAFLGEIQKAAQRAASLTRQLLAFSRRQVLAPVVMSLHDVIANMDAMFRHFLRENIEVVSHLEPRLWRVEADPAQIEQVLLNLAANAGDAMSHGGTFTITTANVVVDEAFSRKQPDVSPGRYAKISITDTGTGMDERTQARLFEPFFTTKEIGKGPGLGLATAYGILKQSGGHIEVESELGKGTTFNIYLPAHAEDPAEASGSSAHGEPGPPMPARETILLVEDDPGVRFLVREVLGQLGYGVLEARDGSEGVRLCRSSNTTIHLVLSDVVMPNMNGRELREHLLETRPNLKFLYMSGYTDDSVVLKGVGAAGAAFLQKPFTPRVLARKVREVLDK